MSMNTKLTLLAAIIISAGCSSTPVKKSKPWWHGTAKVVVKNDKFEQTTEIRLNRWFNTPIHSSGVLVTSVANDFNSILDNGLNSEFKSVRDSSRKLIDTFTGLSIEIKGTTKNNHLFEFVEIFVLDQNNQFINREDEKIIMKVLVDGQIDNYFSTYTFSNGRNSEMSGTFFNLPYSTLKEWSKLNKLDIRFQNSRGLKVDATLNEEEINLINEFCNKSEETFEYNPEKPVG